MKWSAFTSSIAAVLLCAEAARAQTPDAGAPDTPAAPAAPVAATAATTVAPSPKRKSCEETRRTGRYNIYFDKVDIEKLVQTVSDVTCRTFILPENVRGKISIIGPENGKVEVSADQFYAAFLAALDSNNLTVYEQGRFLKLIEKPRAKQSPIPTILDDATPYTMNEQMVTRMFKLKNIDVEPLRGVLQQLVSPSGDTIPIPPDTIIINDLGANLHRLERIISQLDVRSPSDEIRVYRIQFANVTEISDRIQKLFEVRPGRGSGRPAAVAVPTPTPSQTGGAPPPAAPAQASAGSDTPGAVTLTQLIPDERTNKLVVIGTSAALERIELLLSQLDIPIAGEGKINVIGLENANAEDVAQTMQTLAQGSANRPRPAPGAPKPPGASAELFSGEVKISADKPTNSLVVIANQNDLRNLLKVIEKLDVRRRQVFIEAVIMEVDIQHDTQLGVNFHAGGAAKDAAGNALPYFVGTRYGSSGAPPSVNLVNSLQSLGGFLAGIQGPAMNLNVAGTNIQIPSFGVVINALQSSSDVNVLSTPHILTTDNEDAEITVGQNVPFQSGYSTALQNLAGVTGNNALSSLGGTPYGTIQRQNVELKLTIKPQVNSNDYVRLVVNESIEEIASQDAVLGPTTSKRSAKTTVVAKDQETIVIGGIMQDRLISSVSKIPFLGDIPIVGNLFRTQQRKKVKVNLLLFLTPYVIRDTSDFRRIFERKMKERQAFIEQFYGATSAYDQTIDFNRKPGPLARASQVLTREANRLEFGGSGAGTTEKLVAPRNTDPVMIPQPAK